LHPRRSGTDLKPPKPSRKLRERRIPSMNTEAGVLISYGFDLVGLFRDIAGYVNQIAGGAKPSELRSNNLCAFTSPSI
jgi:hypothetical protein